MTLFSSNLFLIHEVFFLSTSLFPMMPLERLCFCFELLNLCKFISVSYKSFGQWICGIRYDNIVAIEDSAIQYVSSSVIVNQSFFFSFSAQETYGHHKGLHFQLPGIFLFPRCMIVAKSHDSMKNAYRQIYVMEFFLFVFYYFVSVSLSYIVVEITCIVVKT